MQRIEYHYGEVLNENTGSIFLKDVESKSSRRRAWILCGCCKQPYITAIDLVKNRGHLCPECGRKKGDKNRVKYKNGDVLNKETGSILLQKDISNPVMGLIQCGRCECHYTANIFSVVNGCLCSKCGYEICGQNNRKYNVGDILVANNGLRFLFMDELPREKSGRRGKFVEVDDNNVPIGDIFTGRPDTVAKGVLNGQGQSNGEKIFKNMLCQYNIKFQEQVKFSNLRGARGGTLYYDFMITLANNTEVLIEIDGEQHYKNISYFGGAEKLYWQQKNDSIKDKYAQDHGYTLLRIHSKKVIKKTIPDIFNNFILPLLGGE